MTARWLWTNLYKKSFLKNICQCSLIKDKQGHQYTPREFYQQFHKVWGQLMKTGYQSSCLAHQVERFAYLYTRQVTNLSLHSLDKYYSPNEDYMPHEFDILGPV
ncbi:unnamed protein product [Musa acuminata subsp. malaccensis]|uniref:(wild Malaysian banana) hypothetical protein n=1 Tax=Musa acuminata subsp. malaccensis TaxID=214687 RepID=A0A804I4E5_MUSAM|nr:unnamed protein product [Musa acuminata subsp. malaccensis]